MTKIIDDRAGVRTILICSAKCMYEDRFAVPALADDAHDLPWFKFKTDIFEYCVAVE
jgi:hypothetical protein